MLVDLQDGKCRSCRGQLEIVGADDAKRRERKRGA